MIEKRPRRFNVNPTESMRIRELAPLEIEALLSKLEDGGRQSGLTQESRALVFNFLSQPRSVGITQLAEYCKLSHRQAYKLVKLLAFYKRQEIPGDYLGDPDDWNFAGIPLRVRQGGVHFFHHYTAKFIPQMPEKFLKMYARPGDLILDPFMGCGTTLVVAQELGEDG